MRVEELWIHIANKLIENAKSLEEKYIDTQSYSFFLTDLLIQLGYSLGYGSVDTEYWPRVDISYFDNCTETKWEKWAREVAIEIENDSTSWEAELDKLFCINAGIKVLITYNDYSDEKMMDYLKEDFKSIYDSRKYHQEKDQYLLIFGPTSSHNFAEREEFSAFEFDGYKVTLLKRYKIIGNFKNQMTKA